jgi:hypothetical protein
MATISYVTKIQLDFGALRLLPGELAGLGVQRPLLVSDHGVERAGILDRIRDLPGPGSAAEFLDTPSNPTEAAVQAALEVYHAHACDGVVAAGGGSPIDLAKALCLLVGHEPPLDRYAFDHVGFALLDNPLPPLIAIPTTAGTGSEVGGASIILFPDDRKIAVASPRLVPRVAICDPELTLCLPPQLTAATGMDAMAHCVETFLSPRINPPADAIALDGLQRAARWLPRAYEDGMDREARWNMMVAAMQGALCFQKGLGAVHAISHPLGTLGLHHGTLNALLLPIVLRFNAGYVGNKFERMREVLRLPGQADLARYFSALNDRLSMPADLRTLGVRREQLESLPELSLHDAAHATNPRPLTREDYTQLYAEAFG